VFSRFTAVVALVAAAAVCACAPAAPPGPIVLNLDSATLVTASGLTAAEVSAVRNQDLSRVFRVQVKGSGIAAAGTYSIAGTSLQFRPAFPLDEGREYTIELVLDGAAGSTRAGTMSKTMSLPASVHAPATRVLAIDPAGDVWPANLLRVYVHFSGPMSHESGVGKIALRSDDGHEVTEAFLPLEADFWSPDHLRYTVFFDPGRVKRGILPNRQRGRALVAGRRYRIEVAQQWRDAAGRPLVSSFRREFSAGPAIEKPMRVEDWRLGSVRAATREPLVVTFAWPIDRALAERSLSVSTADGKSIAGQGSLSDGALKWSFTPAADWIAGEYLLSASPILEDPSGNQVGRAFEIDMKRNAPPVDVRRSVPFRVSRPSHRPEV
jgi:hypothetical protein